MFSGNQNFIFIIVWHLKVRVCITLRGKIENEKELSATPKHFCFLIVILIPTLSLPRLHTL
jgi:hypothetical protein